MRSLALILALAAAATAQNLAAPPQAAPFAADAVFAGPPSALPPKDGGLFELDAPARKIWSGGGEAGLTGANGNSDVLNARVGLNADRNTDDNRFHTDVLYQLSKQDGMTIQNAAILNARYEELFAGSPFTLFGSTNVEYDELRLYRFRVGVYAGVGYQAIATDATTLNLRVGAGAVREIGGPKDRWVPEMLFGYDFKHKFDDRQSFVSNLDFYPSLNGDAFSKYRVRARAAYEVILDPATGTTFRIGAQTRYDSDPGAGFKKNDLNYFATLGFSF